MANQEENTRTITRYSDEYTVGFLDLKKGWNYGEGHPTNSIAVITGLLVKYVLLEYKTAKAGGTLVKVNPAYTSQTCSNCGTILSKKLPLSKRKFKCKSCGYKKDRDVNAAKNIKYLGASLLDSGGKRRKASRATLNSSIRRVSRERYILSRRRSV